MYDFLCLFDLILQHLTNWLSYAAIVIAIALTVGQIAYFIINKMYGKR